MPTIHLCTHINAPIHKVFDLARSIELHLQSTAHTKEKAVGGRTSGLCQLHDSITWEAIHFGIRQRLTTRITAMRPPYFFEDQMVSGAFKSFCHQHIFEELEDGTMMTDVFEFESPLGVVGRLANQIFLTKYMRQLLITRNETIEKIALQK